ncbi:CLUMA_CG007401, isoform A [Clunio marinus]|uniref:CLUMA_CG007401, isoform A n=1 Tax=Clunio marinus TaxID=568069 RepID=A0A1J1I280_9DIPT|nr:CLUMA_CG007401, isoform A [Clunio marinus]
MKNDNYCLLKHNRLFNAPLGAKTFPSLHFQLLSSHKRFGKSFSRSFTYWQIFYFDFISIAGFLFSSSIMRTEDEEKIIGNQFEMIS